MRLSLTLLAGLSPLLLLVGCSSLSTLPLPHNTTITNVVGEVWRIDSTRKIAGRSEAMTDLLNEMATSHCARRGMTALPLRGTVSSDGTKGWMEFRCQHPNNYQPEYQGLMGHFSLDEEDEKGSRK